VEYLGALALVMQARKLTITCGATQKEEHGVTVVFCSCSLVRVLRVSFGLFVLNADGPDYLGFDSPAPHGN